MGGNSSLHLILTPPPYTYFHAIRNNTHRWYSLRVKKISSFIEGLFYWFQTYIIFNYIIACGHNKLSYVAPANACECPFLSLKVRAYLVFLHTQYISSNC